MLRLNNGRVQGQIGNREDGTSPDTILSITSDNIYNDGNWHQAGFIRDRVQNKLYLYVDGIQATEPVHDNFPIPLINSNSLQIGRWDALGGVEYFSGSLDEIRITKNANHPSPINSISGLVFNDINGNGIFDQDDSGLVNWKIRLNGDKVDSTLTNQLGFYSFTHLDTGIYEVTEEPAQGWVSTLPVGGIYPNIHIAQGSNVAGKNFGNFKLGNINGQVFNDADEDGAKDAYEAGIVDRKVRLAGSYKDSTITNVYGNYQFQNLPIGTYTVTEEIPTDWRETYPSSGAYSVTISTSGQSLDGNDFGISKLPERVRVLLSIHDASNISHKNLYWGVRSKASYGIWGVDPQSTIIDSAEGEFELPPRVSEVFDARFVTPRSGTSVFGSGSWVDIRDFISGSQQDTYRVAFQAGVGGYPMTLSWSKEEIIKQYSGFVKLGKNPGNWVDMKEEDSLVVTNENVIELLIITEKPQLPILYEKGWSLISIPSGCIDLRKKSLFPDVRSEAFYYEQMNGYVVAETLVNGVGYWLKMPSVITTLSFDGCPIYEDTIDVSVGWNLIGTLYIPIPTYSIESNPPGIVTSSFFGYNNSYYDADSLEPMRAYWVKVNQDGKLILSSLRTIAALNRIRIIPSSEFPPYPPPMENNQVENIPQGFILEQAYPNPFNPSSTIKYQLPVESRVTLKIYNLVGQLVTTLIDEIQGAGYRSVTWNAMNVPSGMYFYIIEATTLSDRSQSFTEIKKIILLK
jgi:hypothetical protein